jgi:hypothetical protein
LVAFEDSPFVSLQISQGGRPPSYSSSNRCLSLKVFVAVKKPSLPIGGQLPISYQTLEGFYDEFLSKSNLFEDIVLQDKEACVETDASLSELLDARDDAISVGYGHVVTGLATGVFFQCHGV